MKGGVGQTDAQKHKTFPVGDLFHTPAQSDKCTNQRHMLVRAAQRRGVATSRLTARAARCITTSVRCCPRRHTTVPETRASGLQIAASSC